MTADRMLHLRDYMEILQDTNCLKIVYYLYKFNPDVPLVALRTNLGIDEHVIDSCIERLLSANIVMKEKGGGYSLTVFGRSAFHKLINDPQ